MNTYTPPHLRQVPTGMEYPDGVLPKSGPIYTPKRPLTYLACPYSHPDSVVQAKRYVLATEAAAWLITKLKWNVFSPITHSHPLATLGGLQHDWGFWKVIDTEYLEVSARLVVLELEGWRKSTGVTAEIEIARKLGVEVIYMRPSASRKGSYDLAPHPMDELSKPTQCSCDMGGVVDPYDLRGNPDTWGPHGFDLNSVPTLKPVEIPPGTFETNQKIRVPDGLDFKPTNAKDRAATNRLDLGLFPAPAIAYGALGMTEGDCKYGAYNYRVGGVLASIYVAALMRHLTRWYSGQEADEKTRVPHLASVIACAAILIDAVECNRLKDDRPPRVGMSKLLSRFEEIVAHLNTLYPDGPARYTELGAQASQA